MSIKNLAVGGVVVVALTVSTAFTTTGQEPHRLDDDLAQLVTDLGPQADPGAPIEASQDGTFTIDSEDIEVTLPAEANGSVLIGDEGLAIELPGDSAQQGNLVSDGSLVYAQTDNFATVIQNETDGIQIQTVLSDPTSPTDFTYAVDGGSPVLREDGGVDIVAEAEGQVQRIIAVIDVPWAADALGNAVPTHYELEDGAITQVVTPTPHSVFPVVADPKVSYGTGVYFSFKKSEMHAMVLGASSIIALGGGATCAVYGDKVSKFPGAKAVVNGICRYATPAALYGVFSSLNGKIAASFPNACYQYRVPATNPAWKSVNKSQCGL